MLLSIKVLLYAPSWCISPRCAWHRCTRPNLKINCSIKPTWDETMGRHFHCQIRCRIRSSVFQSFYKFQAAPSGCAAWKSCKYREIGARVTEILVNLWLWSIFPSLLTRRGYRWHRCAGTWPWRTSSSARSPAAWRTREAPVVRGRLCQGPEI